MKYVYFIQQGDTGPIKIGISKNPQKRLGDLQSSNPSQLRLLHYDIGGRSREKLLHKYFDEERIIGEWFEPSDDLVEFIDYLNGRGRGHDSIGEVVERGDIVEVHYKNIRTLGRVMNNPVWGSEYVMVFLGSGNYGLVIEEKCELLKVLEKHPDDKWAASEGGKMRAAMNKYGIADGI